MAHKRNNLLGLGLGLVLALLFIVAHGTADYENKSIMRDG